jgi:phosphatidylinositol-3-phosphatase
MNRRRAPRPRLVRRHPLLGTVALLAGVAALVAAGISVVATASSPKSHGTSQATSKHELHLAHLRHLGTGGQPAQQASAANRLCGMLIGHPAHISHVIWIMLENRSYSQVIGAPYISTLASKCGVATNYHNVTHPSLPNYIAMTSGRPMGALPTTDCPGFCHVSGPSIFTQTNSWGVFAESMPGHCVRHDARPYVAHHTAAPYYTSVTNCASKDVPLTALNLAALPAFSLIIPNVNHDMHENSSSVAAGDAWLRVHLGAILASSTYRSGSTVVFVTWDEGGVPRSTNNCATNRTDPGCHVALLMMSPYTQPGSRWTALANHYSLLAVTEHLLGFSYLGMAARAPSIRTAFRL